MHVGSKISKWSYIRSRKFQLTKHREKLPVFPWESNTAFGQLVFHVICKFISEESITSHQPEPNNSSTHPPTLFLQNHFTTILTSMPRYSKWSSLPFVFLNILHAFPTPMYAMFPGQHIILDWLIIILFKEYKIMMFLIINFLKPLVALFFYVKTFSSTYCFATMCVSVWCAWMGMHLR